MATPTTPTGVWNDRFDRPPSEEVRALAQEIIDSGDLDRSLTSSGFETTPELEAALDYLAEHGPVRGGPLE